MKDQVRLSIRGIKCDCCDYRDDDVVVKDYKKWLNKPCPKCGANLLTKKDYRNVKFLLFFAAIYNAITPKAKDEAKEVHYTVEMDGSGKMDFVKKGGA